MIKFLFIALLIGAVKADFTTTTYPILMAVGGYPDEGQVEAVDLSGQNRTCRSDMVRHPNGHGFVGTYIGGRAWVCGSFYPEVTPDCYSYDSVNNTWDQEQRMVRPKAFAGAAHFNPDEWWLTGGKGVTAFAMNETELLDANIGHFVQYNDLPVDLDMHSQVGVNDTHMIVVCGRFDNHIGRFFDRTTGQWDWIRPLMTQKREKCQAGLVRYPDGSRQLVVTGGYSDGNYVTSTMIYHLELQYWRFGPNLPFTIHYGASVPFNDSFLIAGGNSFTQGGNVDTIIEFDPFSETWTIRPEKLQTPRDLFAGFTVPESYIACS